MTSLKQVTEESRQMGEWLSVMSLKQAMATELWNGRWQTPAAGGERAWCVGGLRKTGVCDMKVLSRRME